MLHDQRPSPDPNAGSTASVAEATTPKAAPASTQKSTQAEMERMRAAIQELERKLSEARTDLQFRVDDQLHELIVSVVRAQDGSVVRQMPSEVALRIARLLDGEPGGLVQTQA